MIIDRHNYEEFFILYWDGELVSSQKQAVENFVNENPDLQEEFSLLGKTRFVPDKNVQFEEKGFLLNSSFVNITNYEEQLLNYIDDELNNSERKEIEKIAAKQPAIQKELVLLRKTKLQPDAEVIFPGKAGLYRKEERVRVISMTWFRVAVAAALILIAGFVTLRLINSDNSGDKNEVVQTNDPKNQPADQKPNQPVIQPGIQEQKDQKGSLATTEKKSSSAQTPEKTVKKAVIKNDIPASLIANKAENKNKLPGTQPETDNNNEMLIAAVEIPKDNNSAAQKSESEIISDPLGNSSVTKSSTPSFAIMDDDFGKEKGGLKEFLRKTTRVFERRTKIQTTTDDNKLLLGAFAVSLK
ncbi:MAG TPA: hypothetical protein VFH08_12255 [Chitinophagaceae bacterium]|nr:hypothetical protein [Chitinophagaceae bacterium]